MKLPPLLHIFLLIREQSKRLSEWHRRTQPTSLQQRIVEDLCIVFGPAYSQDPSAKSLLDNSSTIVSDNRVALCIETILVFLGLVPSFVIAWATVDPTVDPVRLLHYVFSKVASESPYNPPWLAYIFVASSFVSWIAGLLARVYLSNRGVSRSWRNIIMWGIIMVPGVPRLLELGTHSKLTQNEGLEVAFKAGLACMAFWLTTIFLIPLTLILISYLRYLQTVHKPNVYFPYHLFRSLAILKRLSTLPGTGVLDERRQPASFLVQLERAAESLDAFPIRYLSHSDVSRSWYADAFHQRARAIRSLSKWFLLPKIDTKMHLETKLKELITIAVSGNWDGLPIEAYEVPPQPWWIRAFQFVRSLLVAVLPPLAAFMVKKYDPLLLSDEANKYFSAFAWLWTAINLITLLDPRFAEKLSTFKDLSAFNILGKGKD